MTWLLWPASMLTCCLQQVLRAHPPRPHNLILGVTFVVCSMLTVPLNNPHSPAFGILRSSSLGGTAGGDAVKAKLRVNTEQAVNAGLCGVPSVIVDVLHFPSQGNITHLLGILTPVLRARCCGVKIG